MLLNTFETERLILRPLELQDADRLYLLDSNPEVMKYIGMPALTAQEESVKVIEMIRNQYQRFGIGRFAVVEKESGLLVGWSGLKFNDSEINGFKDFYELGYRFLPETWGKGYASETGKAFVDKFFDEMKLKNLYAYAHSENGASNHVLTKLGFTKTGTFTEPDGNCFWYEMTSKPN
ncbi:GNAT family N-acetyltransferase [Soonwooa sp.]|uniref:GNAT family N-acetyltransferase n=2 Tax=Soonwooa sp. TaxID=1938592 RepID=UPI0028A95E4B|nr:GNAT family N-acetyltransferase [Soonwooa sp.]